MPNPCLDLTCEFICLLNPSGATCACPEGKSLMNGTCIDQSLLGRYWKLQENQKTNSWSVWAIAEFCEVAQNTHYLAETERTGEETKSLFKKKNTSRANIHQNEKGPFGLTRWYLKVSGYKYWPKEVWKALGCFGSQIKHESFRRKNTAAVVKRKWEPCSK